MSAKEGDFQHLLDLIRERHSSRAPFDRDLPVPREALLQILEAARWAPTAHNMQNFQIVLVDDPSLIDKLGQIPADLSETFIRENYSQLSFSEEELQRKKTGILGTMFPASWRTPNPNMAEIARERGHASLHDTIQSSPTLLVVTYDPRTRAPASEGDFLGIMSLGCVMQNLWLAATAFGIDLQIMSVFGGGCVETAVKELLAIPEALRIAFAVRLGRAAKRSPYRSVRRGLEELVHHNRFGSHDLG